LKKRKTLGNTAKWLILEIIAYLSVFIGAPWVVPLFGNAQAALFVLQIIIQPLTVAFVCFFCTLRGLNILLCAALTVAFLFAPIVMLNVIPSGGGIALSSAAAILFSSAGMELRKRQGKDI
jgi:hypothetical protein